MLSRTLRFAILATFVLLVTESLSIAASQPKASGDGLQLSGFTWSQGKTHYAGFLRNAYQIGDVTPVVFAYS